MTGLELLPPEHPGSFIKDELEARGWAQADLAFVLGWDTAQLNRLLGGTSNVTPDSAVALGDAFDVSPEFFLNLQQLYDLGHAKKADPGVKVRASWASSFPVREMIKRGWIEDGDSDLLELQMLRFFDVETRREMPFVGDAEVEPIAAKMNSYAGITPAQFAWVNRVKQVANTLDCPPYSEKALRDALPSLRAHFIDKDDLSNIQGLLLRCGVRTVLVEHLSGTKIDGVCVWLSDNQPAIGLSGRLDRLDNLCFVLRHEIEHVLNGDGRQNSFAPVDEDCAGLADDDELPDVERAANSAAAEFCIPQGDLRSFIARKAPYISEKDVTLFATRVQINPAIVVGQVQFKTGRYGWLRKYQKPVRPKLMEWRAVDGWDRSANVEL